MVLAGKLGKNMMRKLWFQVDDAEIIEQLAIVELRKLALDPNTRPTVKRLAIEQILSRNPEEEAGEETAALVRQLLAGEDDNLTGDE